MSTIQAVIFDWAGTLIDHGSRAPMGVFVSALAKEGITITVGEARGPMGIAKRDHLRQLLALPSVLAQWQARYGRSPDETDVTRLYPGLEATQIKVLPDYCEPIPGVPALLATLRARGIRIGSTTGYTRPMLKVCLKYAGKLGVEPDVTVAVDEVPQGRPAPFMVWKALTGLGVFPTRTCVKVGDTPVDMLEGRNAGLWAVGVTLAGNEVGLTAAELAALPVAEQNRLHRAAAERLRAAGAHYVIRSAADLDEVLPLLSARIEAGEAP